MDGPIFQMGGGFILCLSDNHFKDVNFKFQLNQPTAVAHTLPCKLNAGFRLTCRLLHCRFDDDISSTVQASLAAEG